MRIDVAKQSRQKNSPACRAKFELTNYLYYLRKPLPKFDYTVTLVSAATDSTLWIAIEPYILTRQMS